MAAGAGMTLAQIDLERPGHDVCAQDVVGVALVALNGVTLDHARPVGKRERLEFGVGTASAVNPVAPQHLRHPCAYASSYGPFAGEAGKARLSLS